MYKGDISNEVPSRVLVTTDLFMDTERKEIKQRTFLRVKTILQTKAEIRSDLLSRLWLFNDRTPYTLECVSYSLNEGQLKKLQDQLDLLGTNPFRYFTAYDSIDQLVSKLPFRPEVLGVIDKPDRLLRYGHWGMDITRL
jgi:hypothetical protein